MNSEDEQEPSKKANRKIQQAQQRGGKEKRERKWQDSAEWPKNPAKNGGTTRARGEEEEAVKSRRSGTLSQEANQVLPPTLVPTHASGLCAQRLDGLLQGSCRAPTGSWRLIGGVMWVEAALSGVPVPVRRPANSQRVAEDVTVSLRESGG